MTYPPELEKAERQLQETLREERETHAQRPKLTCADNVIALAAILHFLAAAGWAVTFVVLTGLRLYGKTMPVWAWLCSLPAAAGLAGVALALVRVLELTSRRADRVEARG